MIVSILAFIGTITVLVVTAALLWYIIMRRPTPNATLKEAVTSIRYDYAIAFFVLLPGLAGIQEFGPEGFLYGAILGSCFILYIIALQWWLGPV